MADDLALVRSLEQLGDRVADERFARAGGEGEVTEGVREEIERLGWRTEPLDTSEDQPDHVESHRP
jgi:hypothetical protein